MIMRSFIFSHNHQTSAEYITQHKYVVSPSTVMSGDSYQPKNYLSDQYIMIQIILSVLFVLKYRQKILESYPVNR
jgi:hypothetical protein